MKKIVVSLFVAATLFSCDPNEDSKIGNSPQFVTPRGGGSGNGSGTGGGAGTGADNNSGTSDAPIDGGLSILLVAGAAYGVRRFRNKGEKGAK
jgi:hypothetical protein